jgi:hypothetical protein
MIIGIADHGIPVCHCIGRKGRENMYQADHAAEDVGGEARMQR